MANPETGCLENRTLFGDRGDFVLIVEMNGHFGRASVEIRVLEFLVLNFDFHRSAEGAQDLGLGRADGYAF